MSVIPVGFGTSVIGYEIPYSLRFRASNSAYLSRTFGTPTSSTLWTWSGWVKRGTLGSQQVLLGTGSSAGPMEFFDFDSSDRFHYTSQNSGSTSVLTKVSTRRFRDPTAHIHLVVQKNASATSGVGSIKVWANNEEVTAWDTNAYSGGSSVVDRINSAVAHEFGRFNSASYFDGYLSEINFIDGQALTPSSFGETNSDGVWVPKRYAGTYGTNGFYLPFNYGINATALGADRSGGNVLSLTCTTASSTSLTAISGTVQPQIGQIVTGAAFPANTYVSAVGGSSGSWTATITNAATTTGSSQAVTFTGNSWNTNGTISVSPGVTYDWMTDTPTKNYVVLNALASRATLLRANLQASPPGTSGNYTSYTTMAMTSGKFYWELPVTDDGNNRWAAFGLADPSLALPTVGTTSINQIGGYARGWNQYFRSSGNSYSTPLNNNASNLNTTVRATTAGERTFMVAYDADTGKCWMGYEGTWWTGNPSAVTGEYFTAAAPLMPVFTTYNDGTSSGFAITPNFGQAPIHTLATYYSAAGGYFRYEPPTGFKALCTANLPAVTITNPRKHFDVVTRNGFGASGGSITSLLFQPGLFWEKPRNAGSTTHRLFDEVRGVANHLQSDQTAAEVTTGTWITSFNSNGYTLNTNDYAGSTTLVDWIWRANGAGVSNTDGSITSTVSANTTAGFSIVQWSGSGANATIGHGLGTGNLPGLILVKDKSSGTNGGAVYHVSRGATKYLKLFQTTTGTDAEATDNTAWNGGSPTFNSSVFSVGSLARTNASGTNNMIAYVFGGGADGTGIPGFSKFGSYTGNGSTDGPFVFCGFRPRWLMFKKTAASSNWSIVDTARDTYNVTALNIKANTAAAEVTATSVADAFLDVTANGFKLRGTSSDINDAVAYIYAAFAEFPNGSNVAPSPAR